MTKRQKKVRDRDEMREEALRPSRYLGYDRDQLGMHLMSCEAFEIAESQFRRAAWLNPYEPRFLRHQAMALIQLGRMEDARTALARAIELDPNDEAAHRMWIQTAGGAQRSDDGQPQPETM